MGKDVANYKVSYVIQGGEHPGAIMNVDEEPQPGDQVQFNGSLFEVIEVVELMPPMEGMGFLHATCRYLGETA